MRWVWVVIPLVLFGIIVSVLLAILFGMDLDFEYDEYFSIGHTWVEITHSVANPTPWSVIFMDNPTKETISTARELVLIKYYYSYYDIEIIDAFSSLKNAQYCLAEGCLSGTYHLLMSYNDKTKFQNLDVNPSDAIISSVVVPSKNSIPIELELNKNSRISFTFSYDENIIVNANDKTRKPTYELLYVQLFDPNQKLLANFTGDVSSRSSQISKSFSFVSPLTGNYSAVITNPQDHSVSVGYVFGDIQKLQYLATIRNLE